MPLDSVWNVDVPTVTLSNVPLPPSVWIMRRITASDSFEPNVAKVLPSKSFGDLIEVFEASEHQIVFGVEMMIGDRTAVDVEYSRRDNSGAGVDQGVLINVKQAF